VSVVAPSAESWAAPDGRTGVLVLHGFTGNPTSMRPLAERLAAAGLAVELPRLPGHGTSWRDLARTTWQDWADTAGAALDRLRRRTDAVAIVGLSAGATLGLHLAQSVPADVMALVLINPSITFKHPLKSVIGVVGHLVPTFPGIGNDICKPGGDELPYTRVPLRAAASLFALQDRVRDRLEDVRTPALVMTSRVDHTVDIGDSAIILRSLGSARREQVWLERSFHVATLDYDADVIAERAIDFVLQTSGAEEGNI